MTTRREYQLAAVFSLKDRITGPLGRISAAFRTKFAVPLAHAKIATQQLTSAATVLGTGATVAAAAGVALLAKAVTDYADAADEAVKMSRSAGIGVETFTELAYAADLSGVSSEELSGSLQKLNRTLFDVRAGKGGLVKQMRTAPEFLKLLKNSKDSGEALEHIAGAYAEITDPITKAKLLTEAFGKSGGKLASMLAGGKDGIAQLRAEARKFGLVVTSEAAASAELFNDDLSRLKGAIRGGAAAIGRELIPAIIPLIERMTAWIAANRDWIATKIVDWFNAAYAAIQKIDFGAIIDGAKRFWTGLTELVAALGGLQRIAQIVALTVGGKLVVAFLSLVGPIIKVTYHLVAMGVSATAALVRMVAVAIAPAATALVTLLLPAIATVGAAFTALAGTVVLSMGIIAGVTGIGLLIALAGWAVADWEGFRSSFAAIWTWIKGAARSFVQPLVDAFEWLWSYVGPIIDAIKSGFEAATAGLRAVGLLDEPSAAGPMTDADRAQAAKIAQTFGFAGVPAQKSQIEVVARFENAPPGLRVDRPTTDGAPAKAAVQVKSNMGLRTLTAGGPL